MAELNTRIRLKYDSFENWSKAENQFDLLAGEIAIAYLGETKTEETSPDNGTHPILFKVGPGKFNDLPWASALAADVYAWAKKARGESADIDYTKTVKEMADGEVVSTSTTKITVQSAIDALYSAIETLSGDAGSSIADLIALINKNKDDIATINSTIGKDSTEGLRKEIADIKDTAEKAYVLPDGGIEGDLSASVKKSLAKADTAIQSISHLAVKTEVEETYATKQSLTDGLATKADKVAFEAVQETVNNFFADDAAINDTIDTLKEIVNYVSNDTTGASTLAARVGAIETKVDVEGKVSDAIAAGVAGEATLREEADTELSNRIKVYEDNKDTYALKTEVEAKANTADLHAVATSGKIEDLIQTEEYIVFNCGSATSLV